MLSFYSVRRARSGTIIVAELNNLDRFGSEFHPSLRLLVTYERCCAVHIRRTAFDESGILSEVICDLSCFTTGFRLLGEISMLAREKTVPLSSDRSGRPAKV